MLSRDRKVRTGLWIAIYGPDGAGKSAVLKQLASDLAVFPRIRLYHLRISLWKPARRLVPVTDPHAQVPRGMFASCLKLIYMLAHAWITHLLVVFPSSLPGRLVLFDRYFLDYAVDPRRYRLSQRSIGFARALGRLVPQPDIQFVLDVSAEELQRRKSEVSLAESQRQRRAYADLLGGVPNTVIVNGDQPVSDVVNEVAAVILARDKSRQCTPEVDLAGA
jgi:thymidylate kinase